MTNRYTVKQIKEVLNGKCLNKGWVIWDTMWDRKVSKYISHNYYKTLEVCNRMNEKAK